MTYERDGDTIDMRIAEALKDAGVECSQITPWDKDELRILAECSDDAKRFRPRVDEAPDESAMPCEGGYCAMMPGYGEPNSYEEHLMGEDHLTVYIPVSTEEDTELSAESSMDNLSHWGGVVVSVVDGFWHNPEEALFEDGYDTLNIRSVVRVPHRIAEKLISVGEAVEILVTRRFELMDIDPDMFNVNVSFQGTHQSTSAGLRRVVPTTSVEEEGVVDVFEITIEMEVCNY